MRHGPRFSLLLTVDPTGHGKAGLMNAQFRTPGGGKRTSDDSGRGPLVVAVLVLLLLAGLVVLAVL